MSVNVMSESLVHVMFGVGLLPARHFSVPFPISVTVCFLGISVMVGKTAVEQGCVHRAVNYYL